VSLVECSTTPKINAEAAGDLHPSFAASHVYTNPTPEHCADFVNIGDMMELFLSFLHSNPNFGSSELKMVYIVALIFSR